MDSKMRGFFRFTQEQWRLALWFALATAGARLLFELLKRAVAPVHFETIFPESSAQLDVLSAAYFAYNTYGFAFLIHAFHYTPAAIVVPVVLWFSPFRSLIFHRGGIIASVLILSGSLAGTAQFLLNPEGLSFTPGWDARLTLATLLITGPALLYFSLLVFTALVQLGQPAMERGAVGQRFWLNQTVFLGLGLLLGVWFRYYESTILNILWASDLIQFEAVPAAIVMLSLSVIFSILYFAVFLFIAAKLQAVQHFPSLALCLQALFVALALMVMVQGVLEPFMVSMALVDWSDAPALLVLFITFFLRMILGLVAFLMVAKLVNDANGRSNLSA